MRAAILSAPNEALEIVELETPTPRDGEVLVEVQFCGLCHSDLHLMTGRVPFPLPAVIGHEVAGEVRAVGANVDLVHVGDRVATSFIMPCGLCERCATGQDELCEAFHTLALRRGVLYDGDSRLRRSDRSPVWRFSVGGLADYCVVPQTAVFPIPQPLSTEAVATVGCSVLTAYGAAKHVAGVDDRVSVAIVGAGGVGLALAGICRFLGARQVTVIDLADEKLVMARAAGATLTINSMREDPRQVLAPGGGEASLDVVFEAVGTASAFKVASELVGVGGALVLVGIGDGERRELDQTRIVRRKLRVLGSYGGRPRTDMPLLLDLVARGAFSPENWVTRRLRLDDVNTGFAELANGRVTGRAVVALQNERGPGTSSALDPP